MTDLEKADAIFVFAGRESRKRLGLRLFREGLAPRLILSVGRFEWRRFPRLGLPGDGGLVKRVEATDPPKRHFFIRVDADGITSERIERGRLGTWSEARALAALVEREGISTLLVVSHPDHLPRCLLSLEAFLPDSSSVLLVPVPVSRDESEERSSALGASRLAELVKYAGYWILAHFRRKHRVV